ncbi:MAG: hypothetical protein VX949_00365 [Planctomycetota bacterium]|nr:hypothetical protein [Planctomycetota bacterium]
MPYAGKHLKKFCASSIAGGRSTGTWRILMLGGLLSTALLSTALLSSAPLSSAPLAADVVAGSRWLDPEVGLPRALQKRQPILVLLESPADADPALHLDQLIQTPSIARLLEKVVLVRVVWKPDAGGGWGWPAEPKLDDASPDDDSHRWSRQKVQQLLSTSLGTPSSTTVVGILDQFGRQRAKHAGKKLSTSALKKVLRNASRESIVLSRKWDAATKLLDRATLVLGKDDTASCCRLLSQVAELALPSASPPAQRRLEVLGIVEKRWREAMAKAKQLEQKNRLGEAASALEKILKDYPHAPWEKQTRTEIGRVWRRIQGPGGGL